MTGRTNMQDGNVEEYGMQLAAAPAEFPYGGLNVNILPKQGSNAMHGALFLSGTGESLQADNLSDDLIQRGLTLANKAKKVFDVNPDGTPLTNLQLTLLDKLGLPMEKFGDSTGKVDSLSGI